MKFMPRVNQKPFLWSLFIGSMLFVVIGAWYMLNILPWHNAFSQKPSHALFRDVMGISAPTGITDLKTAARSYVIKCWVWMRFRATDAAIDNLIKNCAQSDRIQDAATVRWVRQGTGWVTNPRYNDVDMKVVRWQEVAAIEKPETYEIGHPFSSTTNMVWLGNMIVDRKRHIVYIHAGGD